MHMLFELSSWALFAVITLVIGGTVTTGVLVGRALRRHSDDARESVGVVQGALLGLVGLVLAFGLSMAVGRYDTRRAVLVEGANAIGTTYLRAQLLPEPSRTESLDLLRSYTDLAVDLAGQIPGSDAFDATAAQMESMQNELWRAAGDAISALPEASAPRLYVETLNDTIDRHTDRVTSLRNRVPSTVMLIEVVGSAVALGVLALHLALVGRGIVTSLLAAAFVTLILFVSFDLDRPQRGLITVPRAALVDARGDGRTAGCAARTLIPGLSRVA